MEKGKARKIETFKPGKRMAAAMQLRHYRNEYQCVTEQLYNIDRWFPVEKVKTPALTQEVYIKQLLERQGKLLSGIGELQTGLAKMRQDLHSDYDRSGGPDIPDFLPDLHDPRLREAMFVGRMLEELRSHPQQYTAISPNCSTENGLARLTEVHDCEMLGPYDPGSTAQDGFTMTENPTNLVVSFVDHSIQSVEYGDSMEARRIFDFELPPAPCEGRITCHYRGGLTTTPYSTATHSHVSSKIFSLLHIKGDGIDPLDDSVMWREEAKAMEITNATIGDWGDPDPQSDSYSNQYIINVQGGDVPVFHYAVRNFMYAFQGKASFEEPGFAMAVATFRMPSWVESDEFGIWWEFQPNS